MKSKFIVILLLSIMGSMQASKLIAQVKDATVQVRIPAEYPGGQKAWTKYLEDNIDYDLPIRKGAPVGNYQVIVSFVVEKDGSIIDVRPENDFGYSMTDQAVRAIKTSSKWIPATLNGVKVIYRTKYSVIFSVSED